MNENWAFQAVPESSFANGRAATGAVISHPQKPLCPLKVDACSAWSTYPPVNEPILAISEQARQNSNRQCHALLNSVIQEGSFSRTAHP